MLGFESVPTAVLAPIGGLGTISITSGAPWEEQGEGIKTESEVEGWDDDVNLVTSFLLSPPSLLIPAVWVTSWDVTLFIT